MKYTNSKILNIEIQLIAELTYEWCDRDFA